MIKVGLIGFGYWGPNIAKNLLKIKDIEFSVIIDKLENNLVKAKNLFPNIYLSSSIEESFQYADAFIVATPIETHYSIASFLIKKNKHVLIQKPMASSFEQCLNLITLGKDFNVKVMTAHTFLFSPSIQKLKNDILNNSYGNLNYISSVRVNLGLFQRNYNVIWDLAPHDFSIIRFLYDKSPKFISAIGTAHTNSTLIDCANITIGYETDFLAMIHINWLSPIKIRNIIVNGENKTALYDDCALEKLKIYDSGVEFNNDVFTYRKGDIFIPKIEEQEAIYFECLEFINSIQYNTIPLSNSIFSSEIVKMIEATNESIEQDGKPVYL